jgi:acetyltransferase-like isoleucine patch superfamily enzyme
MRSGGDHQPGGGRVLVGGNHSINTVSTFLFVNLSLGVENPSRPYRTTRGTIIGHDVWIRTERIFGGVNIGHGCVETATSIVGT